MIQIIPQIYTKRFSIQHNIIEPNAILVKDFLNRALSEVELFNLLDLNKVKGTLFASIDKQDLIGSLNLRIYYFKFDNFTLFRYTSVVSNPVFKIIGQMGTDIALKKVRFSRIDRSFIEIEINENGIPPLCTLARDAEDFIANSSQT